MIDVLSCPLDASELEEANIAMIVLDSLRYDTSESAETPFIDSLGGFKLAETLGSYTVAAHQALFNGQIWALYDADLAWGNLVYRPWEVRTGSDVGDGKRLILPGCTIQEGLRVLGYDVFGYGGVTQFVDGSILRSFFQDNEFEYFGIALNEEPIKARDNRSFPLNRIDQIVAKLSSSDKWFLYINCPEPHYPYDWGEYPELPDLITKNRKIIAANLNRRVTEGGIPDEVSELMRQMQREGLEVVDHKLENLITELQGVAKGRKIVLMICADHGELFGEEYSGKKRWGHMLAAPEVMQVPQLVVVLG